MKKAFWSGVFVGVLATLGLGWGANHAGQHPHSVPGRSLSAVCRLGATCCYSVASISQALAERAERAIPADPTTACYNDFIAAPADPEPISGLSMCPSVAEILPAPCEQIELIKSSLAPELKNVSLKKPVSCGECKAKDCCDEAECKESCGKGECESRCPECTKEEKKEAGAWLIFSGDDSVSVTPDQNFSFWIAFWGSLDEESSCTASKRLTCSCTEDGTTASSASKDAGNCCEKKSTAASKAVDSSEKKPATGSYNAYTSDLDIPINAESFKKLAPPRSGSDTSEYRSSDSTDSETDSNPL